MVRQSLTPAVVDEAVRDGVVVRGHQARDVEGKRAADVVPEDGRRVPIDELVPVRRGIRDEGRVLDDGGVDVHVRTDGLLVEGPVETTGVVEPDAQVVRTRSLRDIRHDVPLAGEAARLAGARVLAGPQKEAVVMLGGEDHVTGADLLEQRRPSIRIAALGSLAEHRREVIVGKTASVGLDVMAACGRVTDPQGVLVPLGIGIVGEHALPAGSRHLVVDIGATRRPARHRVEAPVHEDAQLGVLVPSRDRMRGDGFEGRQIGHRSTRWYAYHGLHDTGIAEARTMAVGMPTRSGGGRSDPS